MTGNNAPLADRMRPRTLEEFVGQEHIIGHGRLLRRAIQIDQLSSVIFYGPPGTGKTTLARIIANTTRAEFISINAVLAGVKDIRDAIDKAKEILSYYSRRTILFVDEVHRFNKAQQDALLPHVENGLIILIGATTENPYFEVNKALVSRSRIFQLLSLGEEDLRRVARQALEDKERGYGNIRVLLDREAEDHLVRVANGDARGVLNALELAVETTAPDSDGKIHITRSVAEESIQQRAVLYDKDGDAHYDTISAFIKSVRGSDPDAALYWMAKMVYAGEDPRFIFRRMMILACEDVGLADPEALGVVVDSARAFDYVGMPEGRYHLAHACLYLSTAAKSNSSMAFFDALSTVSKEIEDEVPDHLRDSSRDSEGLGHGKGYLYPHAYRDHWVAQQYLPSVLQGRVFYDPGDQGYERGIRDDVARMREAQIAAMAEWDDERGVSELSGGGAGSGDAWIKRAAGNYGNRLEKIRSKIFEFSSLQKESLVLDLYARTGLLTFEAARQAQDGGVWSFAHDEKSFETLKIMAQRFEPLRRPQVIMTSFDKFESDIKKAAGKDVRFDAVVGRNALAKEKDKAGILVKAVNLLSKEGRCVLAETLHHADTRISGLLDFSSAGIKEGFKKAEDSLFSDKDDPMVNWTPKTLKREVESRADAEVRVFEIPCSFTVRLTGDDIDQWFRSTGENERFSLGDRLRAVFSPEEYEAVKNAVHARLDNRDVEWKSVVGYFVVRRRARRRGSAKR